MIEINYYRQGPNCSKRYYTKRVESIDWDNLSVHRIFCIEIECVTKNLKAFTLDSLHQDIPLNEIENIVETLDMNKIKYLILSLTVDDD